LYINQGRLIEARELLTKLKSHDYSRSEKLEKMLSKSGDERVADFILFQIIEGLAENRSHEELMLRIREDLELFGYSASADKLDAVLADKKEILSAEVHAAREVLSGFADGQRAPELLEQVHKLLP
jgi:hypothetical protein